MAKTRVLYVVHNHPSLFPGGAETYALELFERLRDSDEIEPLLVARIGRNRMPEGGRPGTPFSTIDGEPDQYFLFTENDRLDGFLMTSRDKSLYATHFAEFLRTYKPDVVHFQHTSFIGYDAISTARRVLPEAPIVYTLHEYIPICYREGQLLRTPHKDEELCLKASPRRCHECFPEIPKQNFFLRERFIKAHFENVDLFIAPSRFLLQRYVDWGIPPGRIIFEDYGRRPAVKLAETDAERPRNRFAFFGQLNPYKGVETLLTAMVSVGERQPDAHLYLHGANLELQSSEFQEKFAMLLDEAAANITFKGPYQTSNLPRAMQEVDWVVVPSLWWENSPLVIQEAFMHGRPVICSDIGGMAEKVTDGVSGLHFDVGDPDSLAATIEQAATEEGLWERLRDGIPHVLTVDEHVSNLTRIYRDLRERRSTSTVIPMTPREPAAALG
jgi:glycosyltransferase involved in cell wall biosynthesis